MITLFMLLVVVPIVLILLFLGVIHKIIERVFKDDEKEAPATA